MILMKRKGSISRERFIEYYEDQHVPLMRHLTGGRVLYRRNYVVFDDPMFDLDGRKGTQDDFCFDVITECAFDTREQAEAAKQGVLASPENLLRVKEDEKNFIEPGTVRIFVVEVRQSPIP
jgi:hypothetical protein